MSFSEDKFRDHIQQVLRETTHDSNRALTLDELRQLAESMGISDSEWRELMAKAETSLQQALAHLKVENYGDAIQAAEVATSINPYIKDGNVILAQSYYKLALVDKNDELFAKADHYARMELVNDPLDSVALNIISSIESIKGEGKYSKKLIKTIAMVVGGVLLTFFVVVMCNRNVNDPETTSMTSNNSAGRMEALEQEAKQLEALYINAIEGRNENALEFLGLVEDKELKENLKDAITEYDFENIADSEQGYRLALSEAKANAIYDRNMQAKLDGGDNRIHTAKKRYLEALAEYNTSLTQASDEIRKKI